MKMVFGKDELGYSGIETVGKAVANATMLRQLYGLQWHPAAPMA